MKESFDYGIDLDGEIERYRKEKNKRNDVLGIIKIKEGGKGKEKGHDGPVNKKAAVNYFPPGYAHGFFIF